MSSSPNPAAAVEPARGRDAAGRFAKGNPGGPGNPYYRRQAELKRQLLACVSEEDVQAVMQTLVGLARGGNLAAIKLFLEYTIGKPAKAVDPDQEELHEWHLQQQTPRLQQVLEVAANGIETPQANQVTRELVPIVGACQLQTVSQHLRDGTGYDGRQIAPPLDETLPGTDRNGGQRTSPSVRRMTAGVPPAVPAGDNGAGIDGARRERFAEAGARAVLTEEIGSSDARRTLSGRLSQGGPAAPSPGIP
jgi:hypothetical protein